MAAGPEFPEGAASNRDYWLQRCEGFRVDSPDGRVGFVEEVRYASRSDRPDVIVVRAGLLGRLLLIVPVGEIAEIFPREKRMVLRRSPRPAARSGCATCAGTSGPAPGAARRTARSSVAAGAERIEAQRGGEGGDQTADAQDRSEIWERR